MELVYFVHVCMSVCVDFVLVFQFPQAAQKNANAR